MTSLFSVLAVLFSVLLSGLFYFRLRRRQSLLHPVFLYLTVILPFAAGGFHTYAAAITAMVLMAVLLLSVKKNRSLRFVFSQNTLAVLLVTASYFLTPLWSADKGMAWFGIVRYIPVCLYMLVLMQLPGEQKADCLSLIPLCGACMTIVSSALLLLPNTAAYLTVNGRLAGFFQYPNTFAAFLLAGLILTYTKASPQPSDHLVGIILILGVILSGSKTGFVLLIFAILGILLLSRKRRLVLALVIPVAFALLAALLLSNLDALRHADRFASISFSSKSFLIRLLYYKDALRMIVKNPFGYGYLGYAALKGTFQTGSYDVTYVHNGLLQLLFEIGWLPSLMLAWSFLKTMLSKKTAASTRLLLFTLLAHCMLDFDLQFFAIWVILLSCLDFESGKESIMRRGTAPGLLLSAAAAVLCIWLGCSDLCYALGNIAFCLRLTPSHTNALSVSMQKADSMETLDSLADRILQLKPSDSLACSAKANVAFSHGKILDMMQYKEQAIRCAPYVIEEYIDYFDKLYTAMQLYQQAGDDSSAAYCREKLLFIPQMMKNIMLTSDLLAFETEDSSYLELPPNQLAILEALSSEAA